MKEPTRQTDGNKRSALRGFPPDPRRNPPATVSTASDLKRSRARRAIQLKTGPHPRLRLRPDVAQRQSTSPQLNFKTFRVWRGASPSGTYSIFICSCVLAPECLRGQLLRTLRCRAKTAERSLAAPLGIRTNEDRKRKQRPKTRSDTRSHTPRSCSSAP